MADHSLVKEPMNTRDRSCCEARPVGTMFLYDRCGVCEVIFLPWSFSNFWKAGFVRSSFSALASISSQYLVVSVFSGKGVLSPKVSASAALNKVDWRWQPVANTTASEGMFSSFDNATSDPEIDLTVARCTCIKLPLNRSSMNFPDTTAP